MHIVISSQTNMNVLYEEIIYIYYWLLLEEEEVVDFEHSLADKSKYFLTRASYLIFLQ